MTNEVHVLATGGTIASMEDDDGARPTVGGDQLVEDLGDESHRLTVEEVASLLSFQVDLETMATLTRRAAAAAVDGVDGITVTHGTDAMAESAYYLDLALSIDTPVIFTGAQRRPDEPGSDGPANLETAITAASHDRLTGTGGVYVAFNETLFAARDVQKVHSHRPDGFGAPSVGPIASFGPGGARFHRSAGSRSVAIEAVTTDAHVPIVTSVAGTSGDLVEAALDAGADGLVVEGSGLGNVAPDLATAIEKPLDDDIPVVVTTRCPAGPVAPVYGTTGGGRSLGDAGVIFADDLPAHKARIKLALALAADGERSVESYFGDTEDPMEGMA